jgi:hypothetical protein
VLHWESPVHCEQTFADLTPQIWLPVQFAFVWQFPGAQVPALQMALPPSNTPS